MADFIYRIAGTVAFSDNSWAPFEVSIQNGLVHTPYTTYSLDTFKQLYADAKTGVSGVDALLALFVGPTHALTPVAASPDKTVTDWSMSVSGTVALDDNTTTTFAAQHSSTFSTTSNSVLFADETTSTGAKAYDKIIATSAWLALVDSAWETALVGSTKAAIST